MEFDDWMKLLSEFIAEAQAQIEEHGDGDLRLFLDNYGIITTYSPSIRFVEEDDEEFDAAEELFHGFVIDDK